MFNPIRFISIFIAKTIIRRLGLSNTLFVVFSSLFTTSSMLIRQVGVIPVVRTLYYLGQAIRSGLPLNIFRDIYISRLNPVVLNTIIASVEPFYKLLPQSTILHFCYSWLFIPVFITTLFKPLLMFVIRTSIGLVLSSIGIVWNETLSAIPYLKILAEDILEKFSYYTTINIPSISAAKNVIPDEEVDKSSRFFTFLGLIILSILGFIFCVGVVDYYAPEVVKDTPVISTVAEYIHSTWDYVKSWLPGYNQEPDPTKKWPEPMSRSNSGGSDKSSSSFTSGGTATPKPFSSSLPKPESSRPTTPAFDDNFGGGWE